VSMKIIKGAETKEIYLGYFGSEFDFHLDEELPMGTIVTRDLTFGHRIIITGENRGKLKDEKSWIDTSNFKLGTKYYIVQ